MAYKRYIKRGNKRFGPYIYSSKKINGKVISTYRGKFESLKQLTKITKTPLPILGLIAFFLFLALIGFIAAVAWDVTTGTATDFATDAGTSMGTYNSLEKINNTIFINAYKGPTTHGWAVLLEVLSNTTIRNISHFEFDTNVTLYNSLLKINDTRYLNVYGANVTGGAVLNISAIILDVNLTSLTISNLTAPFVFDISGTLGPTPSVVKINDTHFLVTYRGTDNDGFARVLEVLNNGTIVSLSSFEFYTADEAYNSLVKINNTHYLNVYRPTSSDGFATVLEVNFSDWTITNKSMATFDSNLNTYNSLEKINNTHYLNTYQDDTEDDGTARVMIVEAVFPAVCVNETGFCFSTIQEAIDNATAGQTVVITDSAVYNENITIDKALNLTSNGTGGWPTINSNTG